LTPVPTTSGQAGETVPLGDSKRDSPIDEHSVLVERLRATDAWLRAHGDDDYTIQLMYLAGSARAELEEFLAQQKRRGLLKNTFVYEFLVDSAKRYYVLYSKFSSHALAAKAVAELPVPLQLHKPYVRNISNFRS
jgi:septal ring-binding cell division protein DamX